MSRAAGVTQTAGLSQAASDNTTIGSQVRCHRTPKHAREKQVAVELGLLSGEG